LLPASPLASGNLAGRFFVPMISYDDLHQSRLADPRWAFLHKLGHTVKSQLYTASEFRSQMLGQLGHGFMTNIDVATVRIVPYPVRKSSVHQLRQRFGSDTFRNHGGILCVCGV
jgi:hypothetical protein